MSTSIDIAFPDDGYPSDEYIWGDGDCCPCARAVNRWFRTGHVRCADRKVYGNWSEIGEDSELWDCGYYPSTAIGIALSVAPSHDILPS